MSEQGCVVEAVVPEYSRAVLYIRQERRGDNDWVWTGCDLVGDYGRGRPSPLGKVPMDRFLARGLCYGPELPERLREVLEAHSMSCNLTVVVVQNPEQLGERKVEKHIDQDLGFYLSVVDQMDNVLCPPEGGPA